MTMSRIVLKSMENRQNKAGMHWIDKISLIIYGWGIGVLLLCWVGIRLTGTLTDDEDIFK